MTSRHVPRTVPASCQSTGGPFSPCPAVPSQTAPDADTGGPMRVGALPLLATIILLALFPIPVLRAQAIPQFSTVELHEYDTINLATLGIQLNVPVRSKAGYIPFSYKLTGAAQVSFVVNVPGQPRRYFHVQPWLPGQESGFGQSVTFTSGSACINHQKLSSFVYTDASGSVHPFSITIYDNSSCGATSAGAYANDSSGLYLFMSWGGSGYVVDTQGNKSVISGYHSISNISDPNGNSITAAAGTFTDTLGQVALTHAGCTSPCQEMDTWTDASGSSQSVKLYNTPFTIWTAFGCGSSSEDNPSPTSNFPFATSVSFPDNTTLTLGWEKYYTNSADYTGRLASLTLPTGGTISYAYSGGTNGINCSDGTPATMNRTTPDGMWTYTHVAPPMPFGSPSTTTVTDPKGNNVVYTFTGFVSVDPIPTYETERQVYNGTVTPANLIQTVFTCYNNPNSSPSSCNGSLTSPERVTQKDVYTNYAGVTGYSAVKTSYDSYGRVTDVKTFDFNATTPTTEKVFTYGSGNPSTQQCTAISTYIIGKPCSITLLDSQHSNAILSQTWNAYDSNGNLTQTWSLVSGSGSSGTYLSKQYTYTNGVVQTATDVNGQVMNYTTTSCNNMFVTSQYPTGFSNLQTSQTWDCNGGVVTSNTDANGQMTQSLFSVNTSSDPFYRPLESVDQLGNITSFSYTPTTLESVFSFNGGASVIDTLSTTDTIARPVVSQLRQGPGSTNWNAKSRTFDSAGRSYQTTLPCVSTAGSACSTQAETQTYDGLNRPLVHTTVGGEVVTKTYVANDVRTTLTPAPANENAKATQREFDGLGRLKSVCLISSASGSGPCGQANGGTGFLTKYTYDAAGRLLNTVENAQVSSPQQTRSYTYDLLGRVLTETNPESGTTQYAYDSVTGTNCTSPSPGDLVQKVDANGNTSCYFYDGLHRNIKSTYAGPNSNGVSKYFVYDSATVNGIPMSYAEGHLAEAYTCSGSCASKITDEGFSYDQRGAMADYYQSSTNSGGYYHLSATHWENNAIKTVSGVGLPTLTYGGLDGVGRVTTVTASSGTNPVGGVIYNNGTYSSEPIGALLTVTLGTGDAQNFTYDPNTGHMTSYSSSVGATPQVISGTLTWNQNGTLLQNNISDAYNAGNTQNCAYLYDDLMRASSVNCVNGATIIWNQTFTYGTDSFGNITKNGTGSFQPTYSAATNQITLLPGNHVPTYDADGDLTNDFYHTYTWLADGHVATIDTSTITYDAMGNKVEENVGGTIHEYVSAFGVSAQMTGQSENATTIGLPGGVQALYSGGTLQRFRFPDWQGTIRVESSTARAFTESLAFAPFGERYAVQGAPYNVDSFTGSPDQIVPDEYDFSARELHNGQGRWTSPDPLPGPGNKYVYADNNPLSNVDLYGLMAIYLNGFYEGSFDDTDPLQQPFRTGTSESYQATSAQAVAQINFVCSALDCTAPGTDKMLQGMGLIAPPTETQTANSQQQAQASQSQKQSGLTVSVVSGQKDKAGTPYAEAAAGFTVSIQSETNFAPGDLTVTADLHFDADKKVAKGTEVLLGAAAESAQAKVGGQDAPKTVNSLLVDVRPYNRSGSFGGKPQEEGYIRFTTTDSDGHKQTGTLNVQVISKRIPGGYSLPAGAWVQRLVVPIPNP